MPSMMRSRTITTGGHHGAGRVSPARATLKSAWLLAATLVALPLVSEARDGVSIADSVRKYRFLGKTARDKKELDAALQYYRQLLSYQPEDLKARYFSGRILANKGDIKGAKAELVRCVALDSTHFNSNALLARLYIRLEEPDSSWLHLRRVLRAKPDVARYRKVRRQLADLYRVEGDRRAAIFHYSALVEQPGADDELYNLIAQLHEAEGETDRALTWRERMLASPGATDRTIETLAHILELQVRSGDRKSAYATLLQLADLDSMSRYSYFHRMAAIAAESGDGQWQRSGLEGMVKAQPRDLESVATLAELHLNGDDFAAAAQWITRGLTVAPDNAHLLLLRGDLLVRQGDEEAALRAFERSKLDPSWEATAQQRIWRLRPPETEEEKLKRQFFGSSDETDAGG